MCLLSYSCFPVREPAQQYLVRPPKITLQLKCLETWSSLAVHRERGAEPRQTEVPAGMSGLRVLQQAARTLDHWIQHAPLAPCARLVPAPTPWTSHSTHPPRALARCMIPHRRRSGGSARPEEQRQQRGGVAAPVRLGSPAFGSVLSTEQHLVLPR